MYERLRSLVTESSADDWRENLALKAGLAFLGLQTRELFSLFATWRRQLTELARQVGVDSLDSTSFGTAEAVVYGAQDLLNYLAFGNLERLAAGRERLLRAARGGAGPGDIDGRWVASHLAALGDDFRAGTVWALMPPALPAVAKQAFTLAAPHVLALWEPQRELLGFSPSPLELDTRRLVVTIPTSAGKTLIGQLLMVSHVLQSSSSVCYVAPTRSLGREVRRAMATRLRVIAREVGYELPDFSGTANTLLGRLTDLLQQRLGEDFGESDIEVMTPERLAHLLRHDSAGALDRFGLFIFDEAQLIGEPGRGFTTESLIAYLHWRTSSTHHRIALLSAAMGNSGQVASWLDVEGASQLHTSEWRGPRRLHAVFTTGVDWNREARSTSTSVAYPIRLTYPLTGEVRLRVGEHRPPRRLALRGPVGDLTFKASGDGTRGPVDSAHSTPNYRTAARLIQALGHAGSVLVVTSTREAARRMAEALSDLLAERRDLIPLVDLARLQLGDAHPLVATLRHGVGYHHAALPTDVLELLEDGVRSNRIAFLTCTSTLTEGVNLPVRTVVIAETRYAGQPADAQITGARLVNALGRAGRAGRETEGWLVVVRADRPRDADFDLFAPSATDLEVRSQLATEEALEALAAFEETLRLAHDAVFESSGRVGDFVAFVWFLLASEEELVGSATAIDIDSALRATLGFQQLASEVQARWSAVAASVKDSYLQAGPRRRFWTRPGTSVGSARRLDELASEVADLIASLPASSPDPGTVQPSLDLLEQQDVFDFLLHLPERPRDWGFRTTRSWQSTAVEVEPEDLLARWLAGEQLAEIADEVLGAVVDPSWRIEQLVDATTAFFEHYLAWTVGAFVELVNERLANLELEVRLCPHLGSYIRFGVDDDEALALMLGGLRSRHLAHVLVSTWSAATDAGSIREWLRSMSLPDWRERFGATPAEMLDLLDLARLRRRSILRTLLESGSAVVEVAAAAVPTVAAEAPAGDPSTQTVEVEAAVTALASDPVPARIGIYAAATGEVLAVVPAASHSDIQAVLDTGLSIVSTYRQSPGAASVLLELADR